MLRVLVVEDEPPILNSICHLLEEYGDMLKISGTAINGRRALEFLEGNEVDIVFTDIKMPVMDGLELARHLQEKYPLVTTVIISGFNEFEFARTAIQYGVKDYLLKPISRQGVHDVLTSVSNETKKRSLEKLRTAMRQIALGGRPNLHGLPAGDYHMLLYCEGAFPLAPDEMPQADRPVWDPAAAERHLAAQLPAHSTGLVVLGRSVVEKLVLVNGCEPGAIALVFFEYLTAQSGIPVTMVTSEVPIPISKAPGTFAALRHKLYHNVCPFHSALLLYGATASADEVDFSSWNRAMLAAIKSQNQQEIMDASAQLADILSKAPIRQTHVTAVLEKLVLGSLGGVLTLRQSENLKQEIQSLVSRADIPGRFAQDLGEMLCAWVDTDTSLEKNEDAEFCERVAAHLRQNYSETISSAELATTFQCPTAQLSKRFKEYFKMSVSEYVNHFRIELAQTMMRDDKRARIKEIALDVGFSDQYYFSKIFKKITGQWPTEFLKED